MSSETEETMLFQRVATPVEDIQIWHATVSGYSFVISYESRDGPGLHGRPGYMASCRPTDRNTPAFKVTGAPFNTFIDAEGACQTMLVLLTEPLTASGQLDAIQTVFTRDPSAARTSP